MRRAKAGWEGRVYWSLRDFSEARWAWHWCWRVEARRKRVMESEVPRSGVRRVKSAEERV